MSFSPLMLGTVQFGLDYGVANRHGKPPFEAVCEMIAYAWEQGVNCLDTAASYGDSEAVIGRALTQLGLRGKMKIISKIAKFPDDLAPRELEQTIRRSVQESLRKLQAEYLDVCLFHHEKYFYAMEVLASLKDEGLILAAGVSFTGFSFADHEKVLLSPLVDAVQVPGSIVDRRFEQGGYALAAQRGIAVFVRSTYLQGLLLMRTAPPHMTEMQPVLDQIEAIARQFDVGREELCVRYMRGTKGISSLLIGADNMAQLKENIALIKSGALPADLYQNIAQLLPLLEQKWLCPALWPAAMEFH